MSLFWQLFILLDFKSNIILSFFSFQVSPWLSTTSCLQNWKSKVIEQTDCYSISMRNLLQYHNSILTAYLLIIHELTLKLIALTSIELLPPLSEVSEKCFHFPKTQHLCLLIPPVFNLAAIYSRSKSCITQHAELWLEKFLPENPSWYKYDLYVHAKVHLCVQNRANLPHHLMVTHY